MPARARPSGPRRDTLLDATPIAAVLSPSTAACDRGEKCALYRALETLRR